MAVQRPARIVKHFILPWKMITTDQTSPSHADALRPTPYARAKSLRARSIPLRGAMVLTSFDGVGIGLGFGIGCGFGVGWGFGGMPLNTFGMGIGGGCGVGFGLGWGFGTAFGCKYRSSKVSFQGLENGDEGIRDETSVPVSSKHSQ